MSNKSMSDVLNEALQKHRKVQQQKDTTPVTAGPFNPIQAYAEQLPSGSKKPRGKRR